jgi:hypothetical protein
MAEQVSASTSSTNGEWRDRHDYAGKLDRSGERLLEVGLHFVLKRVTHVDTIGTGRYPQDLLGFLAL